MIDKPSHAIRIETPVPILGVTPIPGARVDVATESRVGDAQAPAMLVPLASRVIPPQPDSSLRAVLEERNVQLVDLFGKNPLNYAAAAGQHLRALGRFEEAERVLRWAIRESPENSPNAHDCRDELVEVMLCSGPERWDAALEEAKRLPSRKAENVSCMVKDMRDGIVQLPEEEPHRTHAEFIRYGCTGRAAQAIECLGRLRDLVASDPDSPGFIVELISGSNICAIRNDAAWQAQLRDLSMTTEQLSTLAFAIPREIPSLARLLASPALDPVARRLRESAAARYALAQPILRQCATVDRSAPGVVAGRGHHHQVRELTATLADGSCFEGIYKKPVNYWWSLCNFAASELDRIMDTGVICRSHLALSAGEDGRAELGIVMARALGMRPRLVGNKMVDVHDVVADKLREKPQLLENWASGRGYRTPQINGITVILEVEPGGERLTELDIDDPDLRRQLNTLEWMDVLMLNWDRHEGNWHVGRDASGRIRVTGIDNDRAFAPNGDQHLPPVIDQGLAEKLLALRREDIEEACACLGKESIDRVADQLDRLKREIASFSDDQRVPVGPSWCAPAVTRRLGIGAAYAETTNYIARIHARKQDERNGVDDDGETADELERLVADTVA